VIVAAACFCGMASVAANSRMIFAFSRDGALPAPGVRKVAPRPGCQQRRVAGAVRVCARAAYLFNATAYAAVTSIG